VATGGSLTPKADKSEHIYGNRHQKTVILRSAIEVFYVFLQNLLPVLLVAIKTLDRLL